MWAGGTPRGRALAGRYELGAALGTGGFATVYRARDSAEQRDVAVKVIPTALASGAGIDPRAGEDEEAQFERFRQEALALSRLRSRHVARVYDFGRDDNVGLYLVMELLEGVALDVRALGRPLLPHEVLRAARSVLAGLAEAHTHGIVHRDVKPSNFLVPRGGRGLDEVRILDFGIARDERRASVLAQALGREETDSGVVLGTPAYMAPEQLREGKSSAASDVYAAGLVLFDLLGVGVLFEEEPPSGQIAARLSLDPSIEPRVAPPLGALLARMLARDPERRFRHAGEALEAIGNLETAPVSIGAFFLPDDSTHDAAEAAERIVVGDGARSPQEAPSAEPAASRARFSPMTPMPSSERAAGPVSRTSPETPSLRAPTSSTRAPAPSSRLPAPSATPSVRPVGPPVFGGKRLSRLAREPVAALVESLHALDLAMVDALARRERGETIARIARAVALALRLELDAAALILEPLAAQSDLARAFGATLIASRCRRATRARIDADKNDGWLETVDPEVAAMLCALATSMTLRDDAIRNEQRCKRAAERLEGAGVLSSPTLTTARIAQIAAGMVAGTIQTSVAVPEVMRLREADREPSSPYLALVRAILLGLVGFRADEHLAREQLEKATKIAAESGNTLLEARAIVAWGGMLVEIPERVEQGLGVLERATTLLAHGDAPSLEHIAEHNRGAALIIQGRYAEAAPHLRRARSAAKGELSLEHEVLSCMNEGLSLICLGDREACARVVDEMTDARLAQCSARTAAYCHVVKSMFANLFETPDRASAELRRAHARAASAEAEGADAYLLAEALGILYASARHENIDLLARAGELQKLAHDRGFVSLYWFEVLRGMVAHMRDEVQRATVQETLDRLIVLLGPAQIAHR